MIGVQCLRLVPNGSVNKAPEVTLKEKYFDVMKACVNIMAKNPIVPVEDCHQQFSIDAVLEELRQRQFHSAFNSAIARNLLNEFWGKAASVK
eukprot:227520-Ditylum_brightwellii.AAC.1